MNIIRSLLLLFFLLNANSVFGQVALEVEKITDSVYALVGSMDNRSPENLANNATFGVVITDDGVILIDSGGTYEGAKQIHDAIKTLTDKPVKIVINSGGQDHRWLGNDYFKKAGARIIASETAVEDQKNRTDDQFSGLENLLGKAGIKNTTAVYADETFSDELKIQLGTTRLEIYHKGQAHTPGDAYIWLPAEKVMFTGDIVYVERMLGIGSQSNSKSWVASFEAMAAHHPRHIVPGHGHVTTLEQATEQSYNYLIFIRKAVTEFIDNGSDLSEISKIDQSAFKYLKNFESLSGRNASNVFRELEWE